MTPLSIIVLSLIFISDSEALNKLLVASGYASKKFQSSVEVVHLGDDTTEDLTCDNLPDLPFGLAGGVGQLIEDPKSGQLIPLICGGYDGSQERCDCFTLETGKWNSVGSLNSCRRYSSAVVAGDDRGLLVAGGYHMEEALTSTEVLVDGKFWIEGDHLPEPVWVHCLVSINSSHVISIGGTSGFSDLNVTGNSYLFSLDDNKWTPGPQLREPRYGHSCSVFSWKNPVTNGEERIILVAGGYNGDKYLSSVELLHVREDGSNWEWVMGPSLPKPSYLSTMIQFQNTVIFVGGRNGVDGQHLYQLSAPNSSWIELRQSLNEKRSAHVSFLIPDDIVNCSKNSYFKNFVKFVEQIFGYFIL